MRFCFNQRFPKNCTRYRIPLMGVNFYVFLYKIPFYEL